MTSSESFDIEHWQNTFGKPLSHWTYQRLGNILTERRESVINDGEYELCSLTIEEGVVKKPERYNREFLLKNSEANKYKCVKKNDIVINPMNLRFGAIAKSSFEDTVLVSGYYNVVYVSDEANYDYIIALLKSIEMRHMYERVATGTLNEKKRVHLSEIVNIIVPIPPLPEQQKIAEILTTWDKAIDSTERLIDNSKQQKKALMQQLLTGKKRLLDDNGKLFEGEWGEETLKNLGKVFIGLVTTMTKSYVDDGIPLIRNSDIKPNHITKEKMLSLCEEFATKHENRKLREGDVVTVHTGEVGVSAVIDRELDGCIGFATLNTRPDTERLNPHFLSWYFNSEYFINWCVSMSTGDGRQNLNLKDFVKAEVPLPSLDEQKKIVSVLTNADKEIELLEQQLADLQQEKKALMQQLLTGKKRVVVDGEIM